MHDPNCTGCPHCSALARAILANPTNPILIEAMGNTRLRALAEGALRTNVSMEGDDGDSTRNATESLRKISRETSLKSRRHGWSSTPLMTTWRVPFSQKSWQI